ncbi:MAG: PepSY-associated TM helix domain-containing protein [Pirellulaceae bacterium]
MSNHFNLYTRRLHRWGALIAFVPLLIVIVSGILLQVKKHVAWVQPPTQKGSAPNEIPQQNWNQILTAIEKVPEAAVQQWSDIDRIDIQIGRGMAKVLCKNRWEVQLDLRSGEILSSQYRRSDFIESLHDGTFFGDWAKLGIFLPNGFVLAGLWLTGAYLWYLPFRSRARKKARMKNRSENRS